MKQKETTIVGTMLYRALRLRREELGLTQVQVADIIGWDAQQMVSYLETGKICIPRSTLTRERIAKAYQWDVTEFCKLCYVAEMERDYGSLTGVAHLVHEPLLRSAGPEPPAGHPHPGRDRGMPHLESADPHRPADTRADGPALPAELAGVDLGDGAPHGDARSVSSPGDRHSDSLTLIAEILAAIQRNVGRHIMSVVAALGYVSLCGLLAANVGLSTHLYKSELRTDNG